MSVIERVRDSEVAEVMYRHMPSWRAVGCYFAWREHYAGEQRKREGIGRRRRDGAVLTECGWLLPRGPLNPRDIVTPGTAIKLTAQAIDEMKVDAEVARQQEDHELAVLAEDMAIFAWQWTAIIEDDATALDQLHDAQARSEEREAFMVRWHAANRPH